MRLSRLQLINKPVITCDTGSNLGVISQLWVDPQDWVVVAMDLRPNLLYGELDTVLLTSLKQVGDVALVEDSLAIERQWSSYGFLNLIFCDIFTERGEYLGKVRDYEFDPESGQLTRLLFDAWGLPLLPAGVVSVYALDMSEVLSAGPEQALPPCISPSISPNISPSSSAHPYFTLSSAWPHLAHRFSTFKASFPLGWAPDRLSPVIH